MSGLSSLIGIVGAGTTGFMRGRAGREDRDEAKLDKEEARQRREEDRAFQNEQRARMRQDWNAQDAERAGIADAMAPTAVQSTGGLPETMDNRDVGQPGETPVAPVVHDVRGKRFADSGEAAKAAAAADQPMPRAMRMADAIRDPARAQAVRTGARQEELGKLQLSATQAAHIKQVFEQGMNTIQNPEELADYVSKSNIGGSRQARAVMGQDGKSFTFVEVMPDGATKPLTGAFENSPKGLMEAKALLSGSMSPKEMLAHLHAEAELKIKQQNANTDEKYKGAAGAALGVRAEKVGSGTKADHFDERQWDAAAKIEPSFVSFTDDMSGKSVESPDLRITYLKVLGSARSAGTMSPNEAAESARTVTLELKNKASDTVAAARAKDPKSTLTEGQAVRQILAAFEAHQRAQEKATTAARPSVASPRAPATMAPQQPAPAAAPAVAPAAPPAMRQTGDATMNKIMAEKTAALVPMNEAVTQARSMLAAAAKSGDPQAANLYAQKLQDAVRARDAFARSAFGNNADQYLKTVQN